MAIVNNTDISIDGMSKDQVGIIFRDAFISSWDRRLDVFLTEREELILSQYNFSEDLTSHRVNRNLVELELALATIEALSKEGYGCAINANYSQRHFHLDGVVLSEPASRDL
jgi:hypothetical protein